ncbi:MAG: N-acetylneuraminate synthase family protein [Planctomycetota bacterium]
MTASIGIGSATVGHDSPCYIIGEIGLNHNGDLAIAKKLIDVAAFAGCDAVKFQKRDPELCVPMDQRSVERDTPWGRMTYFEYRYKVEFGEEEFAEIDRYCKEKGIDWFASCWDVNSVDFIDRFEPVCYKLASASITDDELVKKTAATGRPIIMSSGMSEMAEVEHCYGLLTPGQRMLLHAVSTYPAQPSEINLSLIPKLREQFDCPIGYSGHEVGLQVSVAAVAMGACCVERHITLDRTMWGSDQAASVEPQGLIKLVRDIRVIEEAQGDGVKRVYEREVPIRKKLRRV